MAAVVIPRYLLPPQRYRMVTWNAAEVAFVLFTGLIVVPIACHVFLVQTGLFDAIYGPAFEADLKAAPDSVNRQVATARAGVWSMSLALPVVVLVVVAFLGKTCGTQPYQLGLSLHRFWKNVALGMAGWLELSPVVYAIYALAGYLYGKEGHLLEGLVQGQPLLVDWILLFFSATIAAPILEELLFRGVLQPWLATRRHGGDMAMAAAFITALLMRGDKMVAALYHNDQAKLLPGLEPALFVLATVPLYLLAPWLFRPIIRNADTVRAIFGTALFFAMWHSSAWPSPIPLFFLALGLGWLVYRTQSLVPSMVLHGLFNSVACVVLLVGS
jgi:membrane protease YdiL (CAAX protease family)